MAGDNPHLAEGEMVQGHCVSEGEMVQGHCVPEGEMIQGHCVPEGEMIHGHIPSVPPSPSERAGGTHIAPKARWYEDTVCPVSPYTKSVTSPKVE